MAVQSREERTLMFNSPDELRDTIQGLLPELEKAYHGRKPNKAGAQAWADAMEETIERAFCLLEIEEQYPELEEFFAKLKASAKRADDELFRYGKNMDLPHYIP
jgi:hypothetical protein